MPTVNLNGNRWLNVNDISYRKYTVKQKRLRSFAYNCLNLSTLSEQHKTVIYVFFFFYFFQYFIYQPFILVSAFHSLQKLDQNDTIRIELYYFPKILNPDVSEMSICKGTLSTLNIKNIGNAFTKIHTHSTPNLWTFSHTMCYTKKFKFLS